MAQQSCAADMFPSSPPPPSLLLPSVKNLYLQSDVHLLNEKFLTFQTYLLKTELNTAYPPRQKNCF